MYSCISANNSEGSMDKSDGSSSQSCSHSSQEQRGKFTKNTARTSADIEN